MINDSCKMFEMTHGFLEERKVPSGFDTKTVEKAFEFAKKAHKNQKRKSGEPYITHPKAVAEILISLGMDANIVAAGLLHDVVEDTKVTQKELMEKFGYDIANMAAGVTKLGEVDFSDLPTEEEIEQAKAQTQIESMRKLFLSMAQDVRVVVVKLADRLHNMQTIKALVKKDQIRISRETLNIFAPLALRLGMGEIKGELEDLAFPIVYPEEYKHVKKEANRRYKAADRQVLILKRLISEKLAEEKINARVEGRAKHLHSLFRKLERSRINWDFDKIYDLIALRIITEEPEDCYRALGTIHKMYRPVPNYIRDYIASPKPNGYRSIHTSVFGPDGQVFEIQIRTKKMHEEAEFGVASHLHYSETKAKGASDEHLTGGTFAKEKQTNFLKQISQWQKTAKTSEEFLEGLRFDFLDDRIFVFSPKGDVFDLPKDSTPLDFAYEVHSRIGDKCVGAKVNGKIVSLDSKLKNQDVVEILTQKNSTPKQSWLDIVKTSKAKQNIRSYFRKFDHEKHCAQGTKIVEEELGILEIKISEIPEAEIRESLSFSNFKALPDLYASVGAGVTTPNQAIKIILRKPFIDRYPRVVPKKVSGLRKTNAKDLKIKIAPCCKPSDKDKTICYTTRGKGFTIHKANCPNVKGLEEERFLEYDPWAKNPTKVRISVIGKDRVGMIRDVTSAISAQNVNIEKIKNAHKKGKTYFDIVLTVFDMIDCRNVIQKIKEVNDVIEVKRVA